MKNINYLIICIAISLFSTNAISQHTEEEHSDHPSEKSHHFHKHHMSLFGGMTTNFTQNDNFLTVGLDYEYRLPFAHNKFGVGLGAEYDSGDTKEMLFELLLIYHPVGGLKFVTGPMFAIVEEHVEGNHGTHEEGETTTENEFGFRIGCAYDFHVNKFTISPTVNLDFISQTTAMVYGIAFGFGL